MSKNKLSVFCFIIGITTISISYLYTLGVFEKMKKSVTTFGCFVRKKLQSELKNKCVILKENYIIQKLLDIDF